MRRTTDWPLIGRVEELDLLDELLNDPRVRGVVVAGPAGTGKTRLMREVVARRQESGVDADVVVATRSAGSIPLGPLAGLLPPAPEDVTAGFDDLRWARAALAEASTAGRLLVVDDAHHLDPASAALVHQLAVDRARVVLLTVRSREPTPDAVVGLWKDGFAERLELQPLSRAEVAELVAGALEGDVDPSTVAALFDVSGGNPMFLRELVIEARSSGALAAAGRVWRLDGRLAVPASIEELVRERLLTLDGPERAALVTLAVGDRLELSLLADLHPDADLARLERLGLVAVARDEDTQMVVPAHPMYAEVVRAQATTTTTITVARRLAEAMESRGAAGPGDVLRVAKWRLVVGGSLDPGLVVTAARQAYHGGDFELAEQLARRALEEPDAPTVVRVLLGRLLTERGRQAESEEALAGLVLEDLPPAEAVRVAERRSDNLYYGLGRGDDADRVLDDAMDLLGDPVALVETQAWMRLMSGRPGAAVQTLDRVGRDVEETVLMSVIRAWGQAMSGVTTEALQVAKDTVARTDDTDAGGGHDRVWAELALCTAWTHTGALAEAEQHARARHVAPGALPPYLQARWAWALADVLVEQGRIAEAESAYRQSAAIHRRIGQEGFLRRSLAAQATCAAQRGRVDDARDALQEVDTLPADPVHLFDSELHAARGWTAAAAGQLSTARRHLEAAVDEAADQGMLVAEARWRHDTLRLGSSPTAARALAGLADQTDAPGVRLRAEHARATSLWDADALADAAAGFERAGHLLHAAEVYTQAAEALHAIDRRRSTMAQRRAAGLRDRCGDVRTPALHTRNPIDPLTAREREVVTMAASGRSSADIADELVLSIRTINNHLQRAYIKLGVHSRDEAADTLELVRGSGLTGP